MKTLTSFLGIAFVAFMLSCGNSNDSEKAKQDSAHRADSIKRLSSFDTPDAFGNALVSAISRNDYAAFSNMLITKEEMTQLMNASTDPEDKEALKNVDQIQKDIISRSRTSFDDVRNGGLKDGIIWEQAKYKKSEYQMSKKDGIESMELKIIVDYKGAEYQMEVSKIAKTSSGWKLVGGLMYGNSEEMMQRYMDSLNMMMAIDSMANELNQ